MNILRTFINNNCKSRLIQNATVEVERLERTPALIPKCTFLNVYIVQYICFNICTKT